ncbi:MAG: hypothetical protein QGG40_18420, partial [Myxococcota bacterium]|nr:hypothetical protein [Myxococcota bacterium]
TDDPDDLTWAKFFDPIDDGGLTVRPEVYYAATSSWHSDGSLGIYWGTGTPYDRTSSAPGYFFAVKDNAPGSCESFEALPITDCGAEGIYQLDPGEGLTSDPLVYSGVVYFTTWVPEEDLCDGGEGRIYGLDFEDCEPGMDTDGDGSATTDDEDYVTVDGYPSQVTVTEQGTIIYGSSNPDVDGDGDAVGIISAVNDPFLGTQSMAWMEVF